VVVDGTISLGCAVEQVA